MLEVGPSCSQRGMDATPYATPGMYNTIGSYLRLDRPPSTITARIRCLPFDRIGARYRPAPTPSPSGLVTWSAYPLFGLLGFINRGSRFGSCP